MVLFTEQGGDCSPTFMGGKGLLWKEFVTAVVKKVLVWNSRRNLLTRDSPFSIKGCA
jgi:hypothetical protein